jgi:hypothetical protein
MAASTQALATNRTPIRQRAGQSSSSAGWRLSAAGLAIAAALLADVAPSALAADRPTKASIQAQMDAGEFGPAIAQAGEVGQIDQRDGWLQRIAKAQNQAGARMAGVSTAGFIGNDLARAAALQEFGPAPPRGAQGGGAQADFQSLIDLITTTIAPTSWDEVGGPGTIAPYRTGVHVDAEGVLRKVEQQAPTGDGLALLREAAKDRGDNLDAHRASSLRKVSLPRLERALQLLAAQGKQPTEEMQYLAGIERVQYVLLYPETGDLVLAGPADHWRVDDQNRVVGNQSGRPVVRLEDFVVVLRTVMGRDKAVFGCSITPQEENLKRTKEFLELSAKKPLAPGQRDAWLKKVRDQVGKQLIEVDGIDPRTRAGQVLVEADYHMKLVGMGLEPGTAGVVSYLNSIKLAPGEAPPALDVLRWWFTMNYDAVHFGPDRQAFELRGVGVQVLGENEMLTALGKREHTNQAQPLNQAFTQSFTDHFPALAQKYPVYAELQNVFDLALVAAIMKTQQLPEKVDWHMTCFRDSNQYAPVLSPAPKTVESVVNHRVVNRVHILAGVSGGVEANPWKYVAPESLKADNTGKLRTQLESSNPGELPRDSWWWD